MKPAGYDRVLGEALGFDEETLLLNRYGKLTADQVGLFRALYTGLATIAILFLIGLGAIVLVTTRFFSASRNLQMLGLLLLAGWTAFWFYGMYRVVFGGVGNAGSKPTQPGVARGKAVLRQHRAGEHITYQLVLQEHTFGIPEALYRVLSNNETYVAYFAPHSGRLLTIERLLPEDTSGG